MSRSDTSPHPGVIAEHYASGYEAQRLNTGVGNLERVRTRDLIRQFGPRVPAEILDVGGGPGEHACWLASEGYRVHLVDLVPLHVELALRLSAMQRASPLAGASVGDARALEFDSERFDCVLLLGPLYHLTGREDRLKALREVHRVLKPGGVLLAAAICRFASTLDGLCRGLLEDAAFVDIVHRDLVDGHHTNPTKNPDYFMETFFHHPTQLAAEIEEAGFNIERVCAIEGPAWLAKDFERWWEDSRRRELLLGLSRALQDEPSLLGASPHIMSIGSRQV